MADNTLSSSAQDAGVGVGEGVDASPSAPAHTFAFGMLLKPEFLLVEAQVVFTALTVIWLGAHASLRRPPSAAPAKPKNGKKAKDDQFTEGFAASDAIMLPIMAGSVLIGLYYLIEWMQDPDFLNKCLRIYMSTISIASLGRMAGDALNIITSLAFPGIWADRKGNVYLINSERRFQFQIDDKGGESVVAGKRTPFPSFLGSVPLSDRMVQTAWEVRHLLTEEWTVRCAMHGVGLAKFNLKLSSLLGFLIAILASVMYHTTGGNALSNLLGSAFGYASFSVMSPTSFAIGSMVLAGLFFYDIVMVFYTPYMITVAKKVDAPIKLVFQNTSGVSMLGLGDIIIPGLLIGLALRFDMYRFYEKKIKLEPIELSSEMTSSTAEETVVTTETKYRRVKPTYVDPQDQWGNRFWTTKLGNLLPVPEVSSVRATTAFPKPYFYASMLGYALGMLLTLTMLLVFNHGQPALLYLVPGVIGSVWLTALARGELREMWGYVEDGSMDTEDVVVDLDAAGQVIKKTQPPDGQDAEKIKDGESAGDAPKTVVKEKETEKGDYDVFLFSITAPRHTAPQQTDPKRD